MNKIDFFIRLVIFFSLVSTVSGCFSDVTPMENKTYSINCTGWPRTMETCYNTAKSYCPNGYRVIANQPAYVANITLTAQDIAPDRVKIRGIVIQCK